MERNVLFAGFLLAVLSGSVAAWAASVSFGASVSAEASAAADGSRIGPWFGNVPFETVHRGQYDYFGFQEPTHRVARNATAWKELWMMGQNVQDQPAPEVDFSKRIVVAVFSGFKPTGGYDLEVRRVIRTPWAMHVFVEETSPGKGCFVTQALTDPNHMVSVPTSGLPVKVIRSHRVQDCN